VSNTAIETVRDAVAKQGLSAVARALDVPRTTVSSVLAGSAREGNVSLIESRADRLLPGVGPEGEVEAIYGLVAAEPAKRADVVAFLRQSDPDFARPFVVVDVLVAAVAAVGLPRTAELVGIQGRFVEAVIAGTAAVHFMMMAKVAVPRLRAAIRVAREATP
jgi:hypothetical protein